MDSYLPKWLDRVLATHPLVMTCCVIALALGACWALVASGSDILVYEGF